jgi:hypothetical protein
VIGSHAIVELVNADCVLDCLRFLPDLVDFFRRCVHGDGRRTEVALLDSRHRLFATPKSESDDRESDRLGLVDRLPVPFREVR